MGLLRYPTLPSTLPHSPNIVIEALGPPRAGMFSLYPIIFTLHSYWWPPACEIEARVRKSRPKIFIDILSSVKRSRLGCEGSSDASVQDRASDRPGTDM